eukprot:CAMPEP_0182928524 /NCGR_PEP_ID=MMETSP0105_2-20130417/15629_1 /TAXON_ID=81532 ORGANISM="Acanthoeca-like sp., Strain 10tr" /NCGR_SAMPLE_ID=MMETSP0105_2 /ASSEMBLY_ACC=CAM_ASM_000205 /LENGTH=737 /DNA_ID=CAMNT_0025066529 /DNA_START=20 /DNA_END=2233 /DNA_ORIENTATION=-
MAAAGADAGLDAQQWAVSPISTREEAEQLLKPFVTQKGRFLLRNRKGDGKALAVCDGSEVVHYKIDLFRSGKFGISDGLHYASLKELVLHYMADKDGLCHNLTKNIKVADDVPRPRHTSMQTSTGMPAGGKMRKINPRDLEIGHELGHGEFGTVNHALWKYHGKDIEVAVKCLKDTSSEQQEMFRLEADLMCSLDHDHIVKVFGMSHAGVGASKTLMLIVELITGGALNKMLKKKAYLLDIRQQTSIIYQIALGMEYVAAKKVVHRDLAARNVLVQSLDMVKITDFGMSRILNQDKDYYTPQTRGKWPVKWYALESIYYAKFSEASDVWSFGITSWEVLMFGRKPYGKANGMQVVALLAENVRLPQPELCPQPLWDIIAQCWEYEPEKRPTFTEIVRKMGPMMGKSAAPPARGKSIRTKKMIVQDQMIYGKVDVIEEEVIKEEERESFANSIRESRLDKAAGFVALDFVRPDPKSKLGQGVFGPVLLAGSPAIPGFKGKLAVRFVENTVGFFDPDRFCAEAAKLVVLQSPHIVRFVGFSTSKEALLLLSEFVAGGPLTTVLRKKKFSPGSKFGFCKDIAAGMGFLETNRVVHGCLSARHVLVDGNYKACRVGSAGMLRALQLGPEYYRSDVGGKWPMKWMAPETLNSSEFTSQTDVWGFGMTVWEVLMDGRVPFDTCTGEQIVDCIISHKMPELSREFSAGPFAWCANVVASCWDADPSKRMPFATYGAAFAKESFP